ncbi:MAG: hypothetical protein NkDv07_0461 [Candidatus Improbicoccus devescovinae]|nr:MAG: hypothetical protein NkDv07_0461 [Candidatus Improbicoccus devescovinae]
MKFNLYQELGNFSRSVRANHLSSSTIALWFAIVSKANELYWMDEFGFTVAELEVFSGLEKRSILNARNQLKQFGFIDFRTRGGNKCTFYKLLPQCAESTSESTLPWYKFAPQNVPHDVPQCVPHDCTIPNTIPYQTKQENINTTENTNVFSRSTTTAIAPQKQENTAIKSKNFIVLFEKFWSAYPKKVAKQAAFKAFNRIKPDSEVTREILEGVAKWQNSGNWADMQFVPNPATFLNGRRWEDEIPKKSYFPGNREFVDDEGLTVESRKFLEENPLWKPGTPKFKILRTGEKVGNWLGNGGYNIRGEKYENKYAHLG